MDKKTVLLILAGAFVVLFAGVFLFSRPAGNAFTPGVITVWGTLPKADIADVIIQYQKDHKGSQVSYKEKPVKDFESTLVNALAAGVGPDAWIGDQELVTTHADKIRAFPAAFYSASTLKSQMVDLSYQLYAVKKKDLPVAEVRALPLWVDPLVLFWNRDLFNSASIATAPTSWTEFASDSARLVRRDDQANISVSGAAFGRGNNVPEAYDILMLLMVQRGGDLVTEDNRIRFGDSGERVAPGTSLSEDVMRFYTDFGNIGRSTYSWSAAFTNPFDRFTAGRAGMMIHYLSQVADIETANPHLRFNVSSVPQGGSAPLTLSRIPAYAVSAQSRNPTQAWDFGTYLAVDGASLLKLPRGTAPALRSLIATKSDTEYRELVSSAALQSGWPHDPFPQTSKSILNAALDAVANTKLTVTEGVAQARAQLEKALYDTL